MNRSRFATWILAALSGASLLSIASSAGREVVQEQTYTPRLQPQTGHTGFVTQVCLSSDNKYVLSLSDNGIAILWDRTTATQLREFVIPQNSITAVRLSGDGKSVIAGTELGFVQVWNLETGEKVRQFETLPGSTQPGQARSSGRINLGGDFMGESIQIIGPKVFLGVTALAEHHKADLVAVGNGSDSNLYLYKQSDGKLIQTIKTGMDRICTIAFSPDGSRLVAADSYGKQTIFDTKTFAEVAKLEGHEASVAKNSYSRDGKRIVSLGLDQKIFVWDATSGKRLATIQDESIGGLTAEFLPDGKSLIIESSPKFLPDQEFQFKVVEWATGKVTKTYPLPVNYALMPWDGTVSPGGDKLYFSCNDNAVRELDLATGKFTSELTSKAEVVADVAVAGDGTSLIFSGNRGSVSLFPFGSNSLQDVNLGEFQQSLFRSSLATKGNLAIVDVGTSRQYLVDTTSGKLLSQVVTDMSKALEQSQRAASPSQVWFPPAEGVALVRYHLTTYAVDTKTGKQMGAFDANFEGLDELKALTEGEVEISDYLMLRSSSDGMSIAFYGLGPNFYIKDKFGSGTARKFSGHSQVVNGLDFTPDGKHVVTGSRDKSVIVWDFATGKEVRKITGFDSTVYEVKCVGDQHILVLTIDGRGFLYRLDGSEVAATRGKLDAASKVALMPDGKRLILLRELNSEFYRSGDASAHIIDLSNGADLGQVLLFRNGDWAVLDQEGRYDANDPSNLAGLNWMVGNEAISLGQFKSMYYDPGLLGKLLGTHPEKPREVTPLTKISLYPQVDAVLATDAMSATITLRNRGGGLGTTEVRLNGALIATLTPPDPVAKEHVFKVALADPAIQARLLPKSALASGQQNKLEVVAYNKDSYLASRSKSVAVPAAETQATAPKLYVISAGVSDYKGSDIDLRYAAADAKSMATAFEIAGRRWLGTESVSVKLLATETGSAADSSVTKAKLKAAFEEIAKKATSTDIVVVYLAGHGVNQGGNVDDYFYLTADADSADLAIPEVRERVAVSGNELGEWLAAIPTGKQVLILDTCASGKVAADLSSKRDVSSDVLRSWERLKDRSGVFILAGCASDAVSYEASTYGQGLLTYSLLEAMAKDDGALRRDPASNDGRAFVDVMGIYQRAADRVPDLVRQLGIGGIQRPEIKTRGNAASFDIGVLNREDRGRIPLATPRPVILRPSFEEQEQPEDPLELTGAMENQLRNASARGKDATIAFWDVPEHLGCYRIRGRYTVKGDEVTVSVFLSRIEMTDGKLRPKSLTDFQVKGSAKDAASLAKEIMAQVEKKIKESGTPAQ